MEQADIESSGGGRPVVVWFRRDLRLADNPALAKAVAAGTRVVPVYILDESSGARQLGGASRWWLHGSLEQLASSLEQAGSRLILRRGPAGRVLDELIRETNAVGVHWNRIYDPLDVGRDKEIKAEFRKSGIEARSFNSALLFEPWTITTGSGTPYRVFTPFWKACLAAGFGSEGPPVNLAGTAPASWPASDDLDSWQLRPQRPDWAGGLREAWQPGETAAYQRLVEFFGHSDTVGRYKTDRDFPSKPGTSRLSPHLAFGEIGPRQIASLAQSLDPHGQEAFLREVVWREFSYHLLWHNPQMGEAGLREEFDRMPWRDDADDLRRWQRGMTGYPLVDAGMRELWATGWMHNRVRMVVASFLTKHLLIHWRHGAAWFWDCLVDADWANNSASWQWTAGCGADAAPYFRIFNPVTQSRRFDPDGTYLRRWVPELAQLSDKLIHTPWLAPDAELEEAGIQLGRTYPHPMVDHAMARQRALDAYDSHVKRKPVAVPG